MVKGSGEVMKKQPATTKPSLPQQASGKQAAERPVPSGQERMVTQDERDEVETLLQQRAAAKGAETARSEVKREVV
jgi:hypothetical protein